MEQRFPALSFLLLVFPVNQACIDNVVNVANAIQYVDRLLHGEALDVAYANPHLFSTSLSYSFYLALLKLGVNFFLNTDSSQPK
jgi:hypothetical protein